MIDRTHTSPQSAPPEGERVAKAMARAGVCSRRDAEKLIAEGRVAVNGVTLDQPGVKVGPKDRITLDGQPVAAPEAARLWRYHKPTGLVTTHRDPGGRDTVFEHLPEDLPRVISVGRLDLTSEGLLLLTNDGALARALELPSTAWVRKYRVRAFGRVTQEDLLKLADGIVVDGVSYGPIEAILERAETANAWISVSLREGKNREVRRVLEAVGLKVNRLIRVSYGPFQLGKLPSGAVEEVAPRALKEMLGKLLPAAPPRFVPPKPDERPGLARKPDKIVRGANLSAPRKARPAAAQGVPDAAVTAKPGGKAVKPGAKSAPKSAPKSAKHRPSLLDEDRAARRRPQRGGGGGGASSGAGAGAGRGPKRAQASTKPTKPRA
jgi:23S rRNA pseudouridine2605 synthase